MRQRREVREHPEPERKEGLTSMSNARERQRNELRKTAWSIAERKFRNAIDAELVGDVR